MSSVLAAAIPQDLLDRRLPRPPPGRTATEEARAARDLAGSLLQALVPLDPSLTLTEISSKLGYADQAHLTRAFAAGRVKPPAFPAAEG